MNFFGLIKNPTKFRSGFNPLLLGQALQSTPDSVNLSRQSFSAFCSASINNSSTTFGFHASSKTMGSGSFNFTWLVCSFHLGSPNNTRYLSTSCALIGSLRIINIHRWLKRSASLKLFKGFFNCFNDCFAQPKAEVIQLSPSFNHIIVSTVE